MHFVIAWPIPFDNSNGLIVELQAIFFILVFRVWRIAVILAVAIVAAVVVATFVAVAARGILIAITAAIRRNLELHGLFASN